VSESADVPDRGWEGQVRVRLDQAGHDRGAGAVDHLVAGFDVGPAARPHALDPVAPDHDVGGHRGRAGAVEYQAADEQDAVLRHSR